MFAIYVESRVFSQEFEVPFVEGLSPEKSYLENRRVVERCRRDRKALHWSCRQFEPIGVLLVRHNAATRRFNKAWWGELCRHSLRDQLSFNYVT